MRLTWHEAIVKEDQLIIRWPTEEKRLRTLIFIPIFALLIGAVEALLKIVVDAESLRALTPISLIVAGGLFAVGFYLIWFTKLWVIDKKGDAIIQGGWKKMASLSDFSRFVIQREKRDGQVMFLLMAESKSEGRTLTMCVLDQDDAHTIGRQIAQFTRLPLLDR